MKTCKKCGRKINNLEWVDGKVRNLSNRKFCLICSPFGKRNTLDLCATCHTIVHTRRNEKFLDYVAQLVHRQNTILT